MKREDRNTARPTAISRQPRSEIGKGDAARAPVRIGVIGSLLIALMTALVGPVPADSRVAIDPLVLQELDTAGRADFFVLLATEADLDPAAGLASKSAKGHFVLTALRQAATDAQRGLRRLLVERGVAHQPFYIANTILVLGGDRELLDEIVLRPEVTAIGSNRRHQVAGLEPSPRASAAPRALESNLLFVGADSAWMLGATGTGIVVAVNDTGVDEDHPAIARHYRGCLDPPSCTLEDHNYAWWDATGTYPTDPTDVHGNGTSTTGIVVGDDGSGNQIGMAPGATTVHCKMIDDVGWATIADILECLQWDLAPWDLAGANPDPNLAPDIVNLSWGLSGAGAVQIRDGIRPLVAAGILVVAAAGNSGSGCATLVSPGDFREVLTVGAVDHGPLYPGELVWFSSRGPSDLDPSPPDHFPDVLAPGLDIRTSVPGGGWDWVTSTGASTAHVSGLAALVWSVAPSLRGHVGATADLIRTTAIPLTGSFGSSCGGDYVDGPNNDWGSGTIQAEEAVRLALNVNGTLIFLDGFDQGSTAAWSTTSP